MCGLFGGMSTVLSKSELENIRQLGAISYLRGDHSTGMCLSHTVGTRKHRHTSFSVLKVAADPYYVLYHPKTEEVLEKANSPTMLLGHCRMATVGEITDENAHPYEFENIIGAHNGTIFKFQPTSKEDKKTDSFKLYEMINEKGISTVVKDELTPAHAYALTWVNKKTNTLHMLRNEQRPLFTMHTKSRLTMYWASEAIFLEVIKTRSSVVFEDPVLVPVDTLLTWKIGAPQKCSEEPLRPEPFKHTVIKPTEQLCLPKTFGERRDRASEEPFKTLVDNLNKEDTKEPDTIPFLLTSSTTTSKILDSGSASSSTTGISNLRRVFPMIEPQSATSVDSAVFLYGETQDPSRYPDSIYVRDGSTNKNTTKYLRYITPGKDGFMITRQFYSHLLSQGCAQCGQVADVDDDIYWINETEYILSDFKDDKFINEYATFSPPVRGRWVYATMAYIHNANVNRT